VDISIQDSKEIARCVMALSFIEIFCKVLLIFSSQYININNISYIKPNQKTLI